MKPMGLFQIAVLDPCAKSMLPAAQQVNGSKDPAFPAAFMSVPHRKIGFLIALLQLPKPIPERSIILRLSIQREYVDVNPQVLRGRSQN